MEALGAPTAPIDNDAAASDRRTRFAAHAATARGESMIDDTEQWPTINGKTVTHNDGPNDHAYE